MSKVIILSDDQFKSRYNAIKDAYYSVLQKSEKKVKGIYSDKKNNYKNFSDFQAEPEKNRFKKIEKILIRMKSAKSRPKMYSIKNLNALEKYQMMFRDEERAVIVQMIELLEKVILHKKLNREY